MASLGFDTHYTWAGNFRPRVRHTQTIEEARAWLYANKGGLGSSHIDERTVDDNGTITVKRVSLAPVSFPITYSC